MAEYKNKGPMGGGPMGALHGIAEKPKSFKTTMKKLLIAMKPYKWSVLVVIIFSVLSTVFTIIGPKILGKATTAIFEGLIGSITKTGPGIDFYYIGLIVITLLILYLISLLFGYIQSFIMSGVSMKLTYQFRKEISEKINKLPLAYFDKQTHGEVLSKITNDVDTVNNTLNQSLSQTITSITSVIGVLIMMLTISPLLTLVAMLILPISMGLIMFIVSKSQHFFKKQQAYIGHINGQVEETYTGHIIVKAFNMEKVNVQKFNKLNEELYDSAWKSQFLSSIMMPLMLFVGNIGYVFVCLIGGWQAANGKISIGDIQAFIQYVRNFTSPISQLASISNVFQQTAAAAERVFEFLEEPEEEVKKAIKLEGEIKGDVQFKHINFGYDKGKTIINDFNANIKAGQTVAIVGPTGAGKTTIVKLLMRFYDLNKGQITIDGINIEQYRKEDLRSLFGIVSQEPWLFSGTLRENIKYGNRKATNHEMLAACKNAHVDHFIQTLPKDYDFIINEEATNVSSGQKQLMTIARTILAKPTILILDEATSTVDSRTEMLIREAMNNLTQGRTSFIIAHRLSTIKKADLILVMNEGDIVEQGTHESLLNQKGFYADLYNSQFENA